jgi:3-oxoacyl-[acyl-carrier protein] reductase
VRLLENRVAVITGSTRGIGLAIARTFASHGASLVIADLNLKAAEAVKADIEAQGARAAAVQVDVRDPAQVHQMVETAVSELGGLDILVNNAGIAIDEPLVEMKLESWQAVIDTNLTGYFLCIQAAAPVMLKQKRGVIVNMSSISGKVGYAEQVNYSAAKAGIVGLTKASAKALAPHIRVNVLLPGTTRSAMTASLGPEVLAQRAAETPLGRIAEPEEIANVVLFLASDMSSFMTGAVVQVTGGRYM